MFGIHFSSINYVKNRFGMQISYDNRITWMQPERFNIAAQLLFQNGSVKIF